MYWISFRTSITYLVSKIINSDKYERTYCSIFGKLYTYFCSVVLNHCPLYYHLNKINVIKCKCIFNSRLHSKYDGINKQLKFAVILSRTIERCVLNNFKRIFQQLVIYETLKIVITFVIYVHAPCG